MARNVITFLTVTALACLATVSGSGLISLPTDVFCTTSDNSACTQRYPNSVCYHDEEVCKYGGNCECVAGYAQYNYRNGTTGLFEYSCRPATVPVGGLCSIPVGNTCSGYRTSCSYYNETYSVCECNYNYKPNSDRTDCIPLELEQNCTSSSQCGVNAYCGSQMRCRCYPGYKPFNSTDCTHYVLGETCPETECQVTTSNVPSCGYGTCQGGVFGCIPGSRWWQYSTPNGEVPSPLVDGECLKNTVTLVSTGELCDNSGTIEYACRSTRCFACPERFGVYVCNGATSSKTISAATSLLLLLACYLFH